MPLASLDYLSVVGSLINFTNCMRPGLAFAVSTLSRHSLAPGKAHERAAKRVVMYLYNTRHFGIVYRRPHELGERNLPVTHEGAKHPLDNGLNLLIERPGTYAVSTLRNLNTFGTGSSPGRSLVGECPGTYAVGTVQRRLSTCPWANLGGPTPPARTRTHQPGTSHRPRHAAPTLA